MDKHNTFLESDESLVSLVNFSLVGVFFYFEFLNENEKEQQPKL